MKVVTDVQTTHAKRRIAKRYVSPVPERITGIYRLSVMSEKPFWVDIGGRRFSEVRSLEVFHGLPMYMDSLANVDGIHFWGPERDPLQFMIQQKKRRTGGFRITADEVLPEQLQLAERIEIGQLKTRIPYSGLWEHIRKMRVERNPRLAYHFLNDDSGANVEEVVLSSLFLGFSGLLVLPFVLSALGVPVGAVALAAITDPWRTYINGRMYKNLKEVNVRMKEGTIIGYMTP